MRIHTGETLASATPNWNWDQRAKLGQEYLRNLAENILNSVEHEYKQIQKLLKNLQLDGYLFKDGKLLVPESQRLWLPFSPLISSLLVPARHG